MLRSCSRQGFVPNRARLFARALIFALPLVMAASAQSQEALEALAGETVLRIGAAANGSGIHESATNLAALYNWRHMGKDEYRATFRRMAIPLSSPGSIPNVKDLLAGRMEMALVRADIAEAIYSDPQKYGTSPAAERLRLVATHKPAMLHIIIRSDFKAETLSALCNARVSFASTGNRTHFGLKNLFKLHDTPLSEIQIQHIPLEESMNRLKSGQLEALLFFDQAPSEAVAKMIADDQIRLLSLDPAKLDEFATHNPNSHLNTVELSEHYETPEPVFSVAVSTFLLSTNRVSTASVDSIIETLNVAHRAADTDDDDVEKITKRKNLLTPFITGSQLSVIPTHRGSQLYPEIFNDRMSTNLPTSGEGSAASAIESQAAR